MIAKICATHEESVGVWLLWWLRVACPNRAIFLIFTVAARYPWPHKNDETWACTASSVLRSDQEMPGSSKPMTPGRLTSGWTPRSYVAGRDLAALRRTAAFIRDSGVDISGEREEEEETSTSSWSSRLSYCSSRSRTRVGRTTSAPCTA